MASVEASSAQGDALCYASVAGVRDEAFVRPGEPNPLWQHLLEGLRELGPLELAERERRAQALLREDGASYYVYRDAGVAAAPFGQRAWPLDLVPLLIASDEWQAIEAGLLERAELLNLLLADLYGPAQLIKHRVIPPELIFTFRGFLRRCHGVINAGSQQLLSYAADMVRGGDGRFIVLGDRAQAPSGMGYALENRRVLSRIFPSLFRDSHVHRLAPFFQAWRQKLQDLAPTDSPARIVVLTPGTYNETHFEHAYLANHLGYPLVEGQDLTVRGGYVWMKSLSGLVRVDVIVRRVDDDFCDPVELRSDSRIGVPGLLEVARSGNVLLANPLGAGVLEHRALLRFMPAIGRFFLGREPRLATVRTYWCGDEEDCRYVLSHLPELVIKPCRRATGAGSVIGARLDEVARDQWRRRIQQCPGDYVAQEMVSAATLPAWQAGRLTPRPAVLRSFVVASGPSYVVMPGGLTRVGTGVDDALLTNQRGAGSKDTWILASEPLRQVAPPATGLWPAVDAGTEQGAELSYRIAENLFWMGRYTERAESAIRLLRAVFTKAIGVAEVPDDVAMVLLRSITSLTATYPGFCGDAGRDEAAVERELLAVILDADRPGSVCASLTSLLAAAEQVKGLLAADAQRIINGLRDDIERLRLQLRPGLGYVPEEALVPLVTSLLALAGLSEECMPHGPAWHFLKLGRSLERAQQSCRLLAALFRPVMDEGRQDRVLEVALLSMDALGSFRRLQRSSADLVSGLELLLLDPEHPRSLLFQLRGIESHLDAVGPGQRRHALDPGRRPVLEALLGLQLADLQELALGGAPADERVALDRLLDRIRVLLDTAALAIAGRYFDQSQSPQQLMTLQGEQS